MSSTDPFRHSLFLPNPLSPAPSSASSAMSHNRSPPFSTITSEACSPADHSRGKYYEELWQACAGPLVSLPKLKQLVMYLPQGHIEQISAASTSQGSEGELPEHGLSPHILCRVVDIELGAEPETDEVKAQLSLLPVPEGKESPAAAAEEELPSPSSKPTLHMFCKTLTPSDTSTHGGFSVPRKHASCLPPLDMSRFPPTQELEATDLHGVKWRFRHIYRGQPKRHLLTTGWSVFVSQKRLVAGDAVIFLRGADGELRVGIRRASRQQNTPSPSVLPSQSMHMGVIATATHAITARTMFSVYYKPRVSPAEFIIPLERFKSSLSVNLAVGMRFKMKFETEDASERRYNGTITGIEDFDPSRWRSSKWRSLKIGWDESSMSERPDRVSPWEIELCVNPVPPPNPAPGPRYKRVRANIPVLSSVAEHSLVSSGRSKAGFGSMLSANISTVLQGQEPRALAGLIEDTYHGGHHSLAPSRQLPTSQHLHSLSSHLTSMQPTWSGGKQGNGELFWGMGGQDCRGTYPFPSFVTSQSQQHMFLSDANMKFSSGIPVSNHQQSSGHSGLAMSNQDANAGASGHEEVSNWQARSLQHLGGALPLRDSSSARWALMNTRLSGHSPKVSATGLSKSNLGLLETTSMNMPQTMHGRTLSTQQVPYSPTWQKKAAEMESAVAPMAALGTGGVQTGCKLFGFSLTDPPPNKPRANNALMEKKHGADILNAIQLNDSEHEEEQPSKVAGALDISTTTSELDHKLAANADLSSRDQGQCKAQFAGRSCTKVVKKGSIVGRGVDLSKVEGYEQLFDELERMFQMEGQLRDKDKGWQVAYSDSDNDMLEVGDDPWGEFCTMARKIHILSREEVAQGSKRPSPLHNHSRRSINAQ